MPTFDPSSFSRGNLSSSTFTDFGSAVSDLFAAQGDRLKAQGEQFEQQSYEEAAQACHAERAIYRTVHCHPADRGRPQSVSGARQDDGGRGRGGICHERQRTRPPGIVRTAGRDGAGCDRAARINHRGRLSGAGTELHQHGERGRRGGEGRQSRRDRLGYCGRHQRGRWHCDARYRKRLMAILTTPAARHAH